MSKLLVVDDEPTYRDQLKLLLTRRGYNVETAADDQAAMDVAERFRPDVLVVDWMLRGGRNGLDVAERLRRFNSNLKTIVISGYPATMMTPKPAESNVFAIIEKPFDPDEFLDVVRRAARCEAEAESARAEKTP